MTPPNHSRDPAPSTLWLAPRTLRIGQVLLGLTGSALSLGPLGAGIGLIAIALISAGRATPLGNTAGGLAAGILAGAVGFAIFLGFAQTAIKLGQGRRWAWRFALGVFLLEAVAIAGGISVLSGVLLVGPATAIAVGCAAAIPAAGMFTLLDPRVIRFVFLARPPRPATAPVAAEWVPRRSILPGNARARRRHWQARVGRYHDAVDTVRATPGQMASTLNARMQRGSVVAQGAGGPGIQLEAGRDPGPGDRTVAEDRGDPSGTAQPPSPV